ncbi:hypothetical protein [Herbaspirillum sp. RV1423]|uniref:hypothetical protein n=1 Tax=Herbaspirillum sp. RV1423 TaxID=1443993 RepID=UPI0004AF6BD4|nr:hypothetical protein [Herbaspirillum sp. RV1423]
MLKAHLQGSDTAAIGGDLAYAYAKNGNWSDTAAKALLARPEFGRQQALATAK